MKDKLQSDLKEALKAGDKIRTMTIRGILAEVTRLEKEIRASADRQHILEVIKRERQRRDEALEYARKGGRADLVEQYLQEAQVLDGYLPKTLDSAELKEAIEAEIARGNRRIGDIMKALKERFGVRLDGRVASEMVKQALARS